MNLSLSTIPCKISPYKSNSRRNSVEYPEKGRVDLRRDKPFQMRFLYEQVFRRMPLCLTMHTTKGSHVGKQTVICSFHCTPQGGVRYWHYIFKTPNFFRYYILLSTSALTFLIFFLATRPYIPSVVQMNWGKVLQIQNFTSCVSGQPIPSQLVSQFNKTQSNQESWPFYFFKIINTSPTGGGFWSQC